ncbi:MAG TPA: 50S ribosomal protein L21 [Caulobacteraceae bacterium]|jgi:large subunit ribosomal protein L21
MYAVIKTGGKQYRVQAGDLLVVEKLDGEPGAEIKFGDVLMVGDDKGATLGSPLVSGAAVTATLIETRKGEKVKIFKKTRRQGYRRTRGHRQHESVLRVTGLNGDGKSAKWDGTVDLTTKAELNLRARGLAAAVAVEAPVAKATKAKKVTPPKVEVESIVEDDAKSAIVHAQVVEHADPAPEAAPKKTAKAKAESDSKAAAPKKASAPKSTAKKTASKPRSGDEG